MSSSSSEQPSSSVPAARNNNLIAESDLSVALQALHDYFERAAAAATDDVQQQLLRDCAQSLTTKLQQVVQPVSDEAFHVYLSRYKDDMGTPPEEQNDETPKASSTATTPPDDLWFEEEELLDAAAVANVHELRQSVRTQANAIQELRAATLDRSVAVAERQLKLWSIIDKNTNNDPQPDGTSNNNGTGVTAALVEQYQAEMLDMKASVESMEQVLQETGTAVPAKLQRFQSTLTEIEQSLKKQQSQPLSQIEQAIYHRENVPNGNNNNDSTEELQKMPPAQRLANLLCRD